MFTPITALFVRVTLVSRQLTVRPPPLVFAGKVHGSLARAGKVRGQAPKVCVDGLLLAAEQLQCSIVAEDAYLTLAPPASSPHAGAQAGQEEEAQGSRHEAH